MAQHAARSYTGRVLAGLTAGLLGAGVAYAASASAAPIECPGPQVAVAVSPSSWECVNPGDNTSNAENPKSPQADKDTF
jgi:hypothetical protein